MCVRLVGCRYTNVRFTWLTLPGVYVRLPRTRDRSPVVVADDRVSVVAGAFDGVEVGVAAAAEPADFGRVWSFELAFRDPAMVLAELVRDDSYVFCRVSLAHVDAIVRPRAV
jgi:hypothetical protein